MPLDHHINVTQLHRLFDKLETVIERALLVLPMPLENPDWRKVKAAVYHGRAQGQRLRPVTHLATLSLDDLVHVDEAKRRIVANTRQFVLGKPANNVLLTGARGTGKSSLVKALLSSFADQGLRLIEMDKHDLMDLPLVVELVERRRERFIIFTDDLSFEAGEVAYKALKSVLDGSIHASGHNVLIYATSNRRHLLPEFHAENQQYHHTDDGEVHPGEVTEEKISLSERFGLWLHFYPFEQQAYLDIVHHWLTALNLDATQREEVNREALRWALERGGRSGRVAWQFARDYVGRNS